VLAGVAGSGKTFTVGHIVKALVDKNYSVHLCAHAHTAVGQLRAALPESVRGAVGTSTIYAALGWRFNPKTQSAQAGGAHKMSGVDVVVVDESSMVDEEMYEAFARMAEDNDENDPTTSGVRVLWVGDPAQLPPVSRDNSVIESPVFMRVQHQHRLSEVVRQAEGSPIIRASMYVRECLESGRKPDIRELVERAGDDNRVTVTGGGIAQVASYTASAIQAGMDARAVAFRNKTIDKISRMIAQSMHPPGAERLVVGDPVTFGTRYGDTVHTNTNATVTSVTDHPDENMACLKVSLSVDGGSVVDNVVTPKDLEDLRRINRVLKNTHDRGKRAERSARQAGDGPAAIAAQQEYYRAGEALEEVSSHYADLRLLYSMTAHKSQGSTFETAVIDWQDMQACSDLQTMCRLLYVAVTRPSKFLIIVE